MSPFQPKEELFINISKLSLSSSPLNQRSYLDTRKSHRHDICGGYYRCQTDGMPKENCLKRILNRNRRKSIKGWYIINIFQSSFQFSIRLQNVPPVSECPGCRVHATGEYFGSDRSSRNADLRPFVRLFFCLTVCQLQVCLEQSVFIFLGQRAIRAP